MNLRLFFHWFWFIFIVWYVALGVSAALLAGVLFAQGHFPSAVAATAAALSCGVLCRLASDSRRQLPAP